MKASSNKVLCVFTILLAWGHALRLHPSAPDSVPEITKLQLPSSKLNLHLDQHEAYIVPQNFSSVGIEYLNHEIYGGLYSQMIFGESFEEPATQIGVAGVHDRTRAARLDAAGKTVGDYTVRNGFLAAGMDLHTAAISLEDAKAWCSTNTACCGFTFAATTQEPPGAVNVYFKLYCDFVAGEGWFTYAKPAPPLPPSRQGYIGCSGRSNNSLLLSQVSEMWLGVMEGSAKGSFELVASPQSPVPTTAFHGAQFQRFTFTEGSGRVGVSNYGLHCQHGFFIEAHKTYSGYTYLRAQAGSQSDASVFVVASLEDFKTGKVLAQQVLTVLKGEEWTRYELRLETSAASACSGVTKEFSEGYTEQWSQCSGRFVLAVSSPGSVDVDLTYLSPEAWGLLQAPQAGSLGLPARKDIAHMFQSEGLKVLRMGGSMCNHGPYRWKDFRGPRETRQPYHGYWYQQPGLVQSRGFGMFEIIDLCVSIDCVPIITFNDMETPDDMADFVEYCWGDNNTVWGAKRISDGHPEIYNVTRIEVGNEVPPLDPLTQHTVAIAKKMDSRSKEIGAPLFDFYIGHNIFDAEVTDPKNPGFVGVEEMLNQTAFLGDRVLWDVHVGAEPDSVPIWETFFENFEKKVKEMGVSMRAVILEENGGDHGLLRALGHATYSNMMHRRADFAPVHGYANALEAWQGMNQEQAFPQGQVFTLPNMTFGQPTYWVMRMVDESYAPLLLQIGKQWRAAPGKTLDLIALRSECGKRVVVRAVNWGNDEAAVTVAFHNVSKPAHVQGEEGLPLEENTPGEPFRISPKECPEMYDKATQTISVPRMSFAVIKFDWEAEHGVLATAAAKHSSSSMKE